MEFSRQVFATDSLICLIKTPSRLPIPRFITYFQCEAKNMKYLVKYCTEHKNENSFING